MGKNDGALSDLRALEYGDFVSRRSADPARMRPSSLKREEVVIDINTLISRIRQGSEFELNSERIPLRLRWG